MSDEATVAIRVPTSVAHDFHLFWKDLRLAEGLGSERDLRVDDGVEVEPFDAVAMVEWIVPIAEATAPLITGVLGYLIARRGEIDITLPGRRIKAKNITPSQAREFVQMIDGAGGGTGTNRETTDASDTGDDSDDAA